MRPGCGWESQPGYCNPGSRLLSLTRGGGGGEENQSRTYGSSLWDWDFHPSEEARRDGEQKTATGGKPKVPGKKDGSVTRQRGPGPPPAPVARQRRGQGEGGGAALRADANCI